MSELRAAVHVAEPIPFVNPIPNAKPGFWSPISCTLIYSAKEAVLVDTPITTEQTHKLIDWIKRIAPDRKLSYVYITHGHGDHFFGISLIRQHFPETKIVATTAVIEHMKQQLDPEVFKEVWESRFPNQIPHQEPLTFITPISPQSGFHLEDRWLLQPVECGHTDTYDSTILWVESLKLAVCGDVVYGQVHQMLFEANTSEKRAEWIRAIEKVEAFEPVYVVPGHRQSEEIDGKWHLESTKKYIRDFERIALANSGDERVIFEKMMAQYSERYNPAALLLSVKGFMMAAENFSEKEF